MKSSFFSLPLTSLVLLLSSDAGVKADFDVYGGWVNVIGGNQQHYYGDTWWVFGGEPSCNDVWNSRSYTDREDVSGDKTGVRCEAPQYTSTCNILEMHFSNDPLYHWTIYHDRGDFEMIGLDGRVYGQCDRFGGDDFGCTYLAQTVSGSRKFRCYTQFTAEQIAQASDRSMTIEEAAAEFNVTGRYPGTD